MDNAKIEYRFGQDIPVTIEAEVIVIGSGPGGLGAAVMAARAGADVALIERYGFPGGMATAGEVSPFMYNHLDGQPLDRPVYVDWVKKMHNYFPESSNFSTLEKTPSAYNLIISKDMALLAAEDLLLEAGVRLYYHHTLFDAVTKNGAIDSIVLHSKSGLTAARAKVYVDCSGDADLAAKAGCEIEYGGEHGFCQPMTTCFKLSKVDREKMPSRAEINAIYEAAKQRGEINCVRENVLWFEYFDKDVVHFNTTRIIKKSAINGIELSEAEIDGRQQIREYLKFLRKNVPGFENAEIYSIASHIGVRESRRVKCVSYLTAEAFEKRSKYPDGIAKVRYPIDIHNPQGTGTIITTMPEGEWYEIPYGCIVSKDVNNLLIGGRPISVDHALHSSMRVMPPACSVGQAAGMAAATAIQQHKKPGQLDGVEIREKLREQGAWL